LRQPCLLIQGLQHFASLNRYPERTFWIRTVAVCHSPKRMTDTTVLPALVHRRLAPVNTICQQPRGQKPDLHLRSDQKFPRFTYRTSFHLCTSISLLKTSGADHRLRWPVRLSHFWCALRPWTRKSLGDFHGSPLLVAADAVASSCLRLRQNRFPVSRPLKSDLPAQTGSAS